jgi:hypothetical protein
MEMIRVEDNRSLMAMATREDLHVAFTRHRSTAQMFVQDVDLLRKAANRSVIDKVVARDLENRLELRWETGMHAAAEWGIQFKRKVISAVERRVKIIRELGFKKRQIETRRRERARNLAMSI